MAWVKRPDCSLPVRDLSTWLGRLTASDTYISIKKSHELSFNGSFQTRTISNHPLSKESETMDREHRKKLAETTEFLMSRIKKLPRLGLMTGTGLGESAAFLNNPVTFPHNEVPHFPVSTAPSHAGYLQFGDYKGYPLMVMQGRPLLELLSDVQRVRRFVAGFGPWAPLAFIGLETAQVVLAPLPGAAMDLASGYLFGPAWGTLYSMTGLMIGTIIALGLARRLGRPLVERFVPQQTLSASIATPIVAVLSFSSYSSSRPSLPMI